MSAALLQHAVTLAMLGKERHRAGKDWPRRDGPPAARADKVRAMSFGKNPYVAKAQAAELKAEEATDEASRVRAHRDAAHQWDRAAEREKPGKKRTEYEGSAARNRELADNFETRSTDPAEPASAPAPRSPSVLN
jgi:hypothetical protein